MLLSTAVGGGLRDIGRTPSDFFIVAGRAGRRNVPPRQQRLRAGKKSLGRCEIGTIEL